MRVIAIDPGATVGMVLYDGMHVIDAIECKDESSLLSIRDFVNDWVELDKVKHIAVEWPRIYSKAGNEVADTCVQAGMLWWMLGGRSTPKPNEQADWVYRRGVYIHTLTRAHVVKSLSDRMGQTVKSDAGVWAAMIDLHGGPGIGDKRTTKKHPGGPLAPVIGRPHAKAALAVAWSLFQKVKED